MSCTAPPMTARSLRPDAGQPGMLRVLCLLLAGLLLLAGCDREDAQARAKAADPVPSNLPATPKSFETAKRQLLGEVYRDRRVDFYCGCRFDADKQVDAAGCGLEARSNASRATRIEIEHVFPAAQFGNFRQCWREPREFAECTTAGGRRLGGRECCEKVDPVFRAAHNDLHNLYPVVGEVNGDRQDYNWGMLAGEQRAYGRCDFEIDAGERRVEPPARIRGDIARTMLYMAQTYGFRLSDQDRKLYEAWNRQDPPDSFERERNRRIRALQGNANPFVGD